MSLSNSSPESIQPAVNARKNPRQGPVSISPSLFAKEPRRKLVYPPTPRASRRMDFKNSLYKVLKKIDIDGTISNKGMEVMNDMVIDMFQKIAGTAGDLAKKDGRNTMLGRDVLTAVRILLPGQLKLHAFYEGHHAYTRYNRASRSNSAAPN